MTATPLPAPDEPGGIYVVLDPLLAVAGGIVGGAVICSGLWAAAWRLAARRACPTTTTPRRHR